MENKKFGIVSLILSLYLIALVTSANYPPPLLQGEVKPTCNINSDGCHINGGSFGYDSNGNCYCDMSNAPPPKPIILQEFVPSFESKYEIEQTEKNESPKPKSQEEVECIKSNNCWETAKSGGKYCYAKGYRLNGTYCYEKGKFVSTGLYKPGFVNQTETGKTCVQSYECKTNVCSENICINVSQEIKKQKQEIELLKDEVSKLSSEKNISENSNDLEYNIDDGNVKQNSFQKIFSFIKNVFT